MDSARLGPIHLAPGVRRHHALTFLYVAFIGITLNTFVNFIQPLVLVQQLQVDADRQGSLTGNLAFVSELMLLVACVVVGLAADRWGRRLVVASGFAVLAVGYVFYSSVETEAGLYLVRLFMAWGMACINVMITTLQADYPEERSRGTLVGVTGFCIGLGSLFLVFVLAQLPNWFTEFGGNSTRWALLTVSVIAVLSALVAARGLRGPAIGERAISTGSVWGQMGLALHSARVNTRIGLAYACAFVARGDLIVIGVFFSLWMTQAGIQAGLEPAAAVARAGLYFGIIQGVALLSAPVLGWLNDKMDRVTATAAGLLLATIGYGSLALINDPFGVGMMLSAGALGVGQMAVMQASQTLIAQEAPTENRGVVMGMFSLCGALGIMFITKVGGEIFDVWRPGPFVVVAAANALLFVAAIVVRLSDRRAETPGCVEAQ